MAQTKRVIINFKGGIVSPGYLKEVLLLAAAARVEEVRFGLRQQLLMDVPVNSLNSFAESCAGKEIYVETGKQVLPNIVSSYPAADIFTGDSWLREGVYKDVFDLFDFEPKLKINICDSTQQLVPLFTGHLNWIASPSPHFWYLYVQLPNRQSSFRWKELVYTNDIAAVSKQLEQLILYKGMSELELPGELQKRAVYNSKPDDGQPLQASFSLPYYEGFNKSNNNLWLGIYRRDELFAVSFLLDVCDVCAQTKIGELYTTPWKSLILKGIEPEHRPLWDKILGRHRINVRHAANELNWQVDSEEGLMLKRLIIRHFDKEDVRTYGLCFGVETKPKSGLYGSIIIRKEDRKNPNRLQSQNRYSILYKEDFNPNAAEEIVFRAHVAKDHIATYLVSLCKLFYERGEDSFATTPVTYNEVVAPAEMVVKSVYQCRHCLSVYDEALGDAQQYIAAGTPFSQLPYSYHCPVCESDKSDFIAVSEKSLQLA